MAEGYNSTSIIYFAPISSFMANQGIYTMSDFKWVYQVGQKILVNFTTSAISSNNSEFPKGVNLISVINVSAGFSDCAMG
jgi:hypothetical protein